MSQFSKSFEFVDGSRNSKQLLYKDQLYNKHVSFYDNMWRCVQPKCLSKLSADIESFTITKEPDAHNLHGEIIGVRYAVMRAIKRMKD